AYIFAQTEDERHNTITPIARRRGDDYELDLVLRNNITTEEHPLGLYHPHEELHHIKKENIGLIEVMGLAVLPSRLKDEIAKLGALMASGGDYRNDPVCEKHADFADDVLARHPELNAENVDAILKDEIGIVFSKVLECAGVYKCTDEGRRAFMRFIDSVNA
ncbi:MAG: galactose-1-phosphate uridylyltransferase, partial [Clostridia bacterium]|nr:galactose-1-phosphate uridylyltransferase [Clostridia bacterium]